MATIQDSNSKANLIIKDFSGGLIDKVDDALLPENASSDCQNFISDTYGKLRKRPGQSKITDTGLSGVIQGLYPFYYGNTNALIAVSNGVAYTKTYVDVVIDVWTAADLYNVRNNLNASYIQRADISLSNYPDWEPIGTADNQFAGTYDGNNYTISNITSTQTSYNSRGLFGTVHVNGNIIRVNLTTVNISGNNAIGSLVGTNYGTISYCSVTEGTIAGTEYIGGLVGLNTASGTITNCSAAGTVTSTLSCAGGLVGSQRGIVTDSYSTATVSGSVFVAGGLVGDNSTIDSSPGTITNCYSIGAVSTSKVLEYPGLRDVDTATYSGTVIEVGTYTALNNMRNNLAATYIQTADITVPANTSWVPIGTEANPFTGTFDGQGYTITNLVLDSTYQHVGMFGYTSDDSVLNDIHLVNSRIPINIGSKSVGTLVGTSCGLVTNCTASGVVATPTSSGYFIGGLVGSLAESASMTKCSFTGTVYGNTIVGGLVGSCAGSITNSYATVTSQGSSVLYVGGFCGLLAYDGTIAYSYAASTISYSSPTDSGGFIGHCQDSVPTIQYCYYDSNISTSRNQTAYRQTAPGGNPDTFPGSIFYDSGGYSGYLPRSGIAHVVSGTAAGSRSEHMTLSTPYPGAPASSLPDYYDYNSGGFSGRLYSTTTYTTSGSPAGSKYCTTLHAHHFQLINGVISQQAPATMGYNDGEYSGSLPYVGPNAAWQDEYDEMMIAFGNDESWSGWIGLDYAGTLTKPDTRIWSSDYSGVVSRPDTRIWQQDYSGTVYVSTIKGTPKTPAEMQVQDTFELWDFTTIWYISSTTISIGGLVGDNYVGVIDSEGVVTNSYYNSETSGQSDTTKGTPKTTAQLKTQSTYTSWDFSTIWNITAGYYPVLCTSSSSNTSDFTSIKTGLSTTAKVHFETCANYMVAFNGYDKPWKYNGNTISDLANAPAKGKFAVFHNEQLFTVDTTTPSTLEWSDLIAPETWPATHYLTVKSGDGDIITNLKKFLGDLVIFKRRSIHVLRGTTIDDFALNEVESRIGCVGDFAAVVNGAYIYFVSDEGLCVFDGITVTNLSDAKIPGLWATIDSAYITNAVVGYWDGYIWFAVTEKGYTYNNLVILYNISDSENVVSGTFWPCRNINISCCAQYVTDDIAGFYTGDSTSAGHVRRQWVGNDDDSVAINAYWVGTHYNVGLPEYLKKAKNVFITDSVDTVNNITLSLSFDYGSYVLATLVYNDGLIRQFKTNRTKKFRYVSPKVAHNAAGPCEVRGILMPCKVKNKPKVVEV